MSIHVRMGLLLSGKVCSLFLITSRRSQICTLSYNTIDSLLQAQWKRNCKSQMPHLNCTGDTRITVTWLMCGVWMTDPPGQLDLSRGR
jgi:hypothetical protein